MSDPKNYKLDFAAFAKDVMGFELNEPQKRFVKLLSEQWAEGKQVAHLEYPGRAAGKTAMMMTIGKYLQRGLVEHEKRELLCEVCSREYPVWFAPNSVWNQVMRAPDGREESEKIGFICPSCFALEAERQGIRTSGWSFMPEEKTQHDNRRKLQELFIDHPEFKKAAQDNATVYAWFKQFEQGWCTLQEALLGTIIWLYEENKKQFEQLVKLTETSTAPTKIRKVE